MSKREDAIFLCKQLRNKKQTKSELYRDLAFSGDYPEGFSAYGFEVEDTWWSEWQEASDATGAIRALKLLFDITDEEIEKY